MRRSQSIFALLVGLWAAAGLQGEEAVPDQALAAAEATYQAGEVEQAVRQFQNIIEEYREHLAALAACRRLIQHARETAAPARERYQWMLMLGDLCQEQQRPDEALRAYVDVLAEAGTESEAGAEATKRVVEVWRGEPDWRKAWEAFGAACAERERSADLRAHLALRLAYDAWHWGERYEDEMALCRAILQEGKADRRWLAAADYRIGVAMVHAKEYEKGYAHLREVQQKYPDGRDIIAGSQHFIVWSLVRYEHKYEEGLAEAKRTFELYPDQVWALHIDLLLQCLDYFGDDQRTVKELTEIVGRIPDAEILARVYQRLGAAYQRLGEEEKAEEAFALAAAQGVGPGPGQAEAQPSPALLEEWKTRIADALAAVRAAPEGAGLVPAQARLLQALHGAVDADPAVAEQVRVQLDGWAAEEPQSALPLVARGELRRAQNQLDAAAAEFRQALEIENNHPLATLGLVRTLLEQGQAEEARIEAEGIVNAAPDNPWSQVALGEVYAASGAEDEEALEAYEEATELGPDCPDAHFGRAVLTERLGQPAEAQAAWQRFLELEPDTPRAWLVRNGLVVVREENVTNTPFGPENMPAWSPDGTKLAFARGWDGNVWVRDLETGEEKMVTTSGFNDQSLDWSPDGRWLLYTKRDENYTRADLWCVPADGQGEEKPLTKMGTAKLGHWLANGEQIYFDAESGTFLMNWDENSLMLAPFLRSMSGPWPAKQPAFSSDGQKAAFYRGEAGGEGQIMLYEQWGEWNNSRTLTPNSGRYHYPTFSPDGRFVLFSGRKDAATFDLFVVPTDGSRRPVRLLRCNYEADWGPQARWSPDGRRIAFPRPVFGDIWIATLGGMDARPLALEWSDGPTLRLTNRRATAVTVTGRYEWFGEEALRLAEGAWDETEIGPGETVEWTVPGAGPAAEPRTLKVTLVTAAGQRLVELGEAR